MKPVLCSVFFLFLLGNCRAQSKDKRTNNILSLELGKTGLIYNLNFDHRFPAKKTGLRLGLGSNIPKYISAFTVGGGGYLLHGEKNELLETGLDLAFLYIYETSDDQRGLGLVYPNYTT